MTDKKLILDACCGARMFWFEKDRPDAIFMDIRNGEFTCCDDRKIQVKPDIIGDFRNIPFPDCEFKLVVFDPPHFIDLGENSFTAQKYGRLSKEGENDIKQGFDECMRVLEVHGILIFKWKEYQIPLKKILSLFGQRPLFGHKSGKASKTHWLCFMKSNNLIYPYDSCHK